MNKTSGGDDAQGTPTDKMLQVATSSSSASCFNFSAGWTKEQEEEAITAFKESAQVSVRDFFLFRLIFFAILFGSPSFSFSSSSSGCSGFLFDQDPAP